MKDVRTILTGDASVMHLSITRVKGSSPRDEGAEMFVTTTQTAGSIGGGQAEWQALHHARKMLARGETAAQLSISLGPEIGQCCGGRVDIELKRLSDSQCADHLARLENQRLPQLLILGAGHVGRALATIAASLPLRVILIDSRAAELAKAPAETETRLTPLPEAEIDGAPPASAYVVATHDHGLDFLLTLAALRRADAAYVGLIGSATKRARFERFARETANMQAGHLTCPIGAAGLGDKRPEVIALMTLQEVFAAMHRARAAQDDICRAEL